MLCGPCDPDQASLLTHQVLLLSTFLVPSGSLVVKDGLVQFEFETGAIVVVVGLTVVVVVALTVVVVAFSVVVGIGMAVVVVVTSGTVVVLPLSPPLVTVVDVVDAHRCCAHRCKNRCQAARRFPLVLLLPWKLLLLLLNRPHAMF